MRPDEIGSSCDDCSVPLRLVLCVAGLALGATSLWIAVGTTPLHRSPVGRGVARSLCLVPVGHCWPAPSGFSARRSRNVVGPLLVLASDAWFAAEWHNPGASSAWCSRSALCCRVLPPAGRPGRPRLSKGRRGPARRASPSSRRSPARSWCSACCRRSRSTRRQSCAQCPANLLAVGMTRGSSPGRPRSASASGSPGRSPGARAALAPPSLDRGSAADRRPGARAGRRVRRPRRRRLRRPRPARRHGILLLDRQLRLAQAAALSAVALGVAWQWVRVRRTRASVAAWWSTSASHRRRAGCATRWPRRWATPPSSGLPRRRRAPGGRRRTAGRATRRRAQAVTELARDGRAVALILHRRDLLGTRTSSARSPRPHGWAWRTSACRPRRAPSSRTCAPRAPGSSRPGTRSGAASSSTSTTARSSAWSALPWGSGSTRSRLEARRRRRGRGAARRGGGGAARRDRRAARARSPGLYPARARRPRTGRCLRGPGGGGSASARVGVPPNGLPAAGRGAAYACRRRGPTGPVRVQAALEGDLRRRRRGRRAGRDLVDLEDRVGALGGTLVVDGAAGRVRSGRRSRARRDRGRRGAAARGTRAAPGRGRLRGRRHGRRPRGAPGPVEPTRPTSR